MFRKNFRPIPVTALLSGIGMAVSVGATKFALWATGSGDPLFAYILAVTIPAVMAPLTILPIALAVRRLQRMRDELERLARTDVLTGLPNRRAFFERAEAILARRAADTIATLMIDVDHFKAINDRFGHDTGDALLCGIGRAIDRAVAAASAPRSVAARLGGEEFAVVVAGLAPSAVARLADRICSETRLVGCDREDGPVAATVSAGVAMRAGGMGIDALLKAADDAVYLAKRSGRDRWAFAIGQADEVATPNGAHGAAIRQTAR